MNAQIDFLKRCKELGLQGGKLSNWLDEIESLRAENSALKERVVTLEKLQGVALIESLRAEIERLKTVPMMYRRMAFNAQLQDENNELRQRVTEKDEVIAEAGEMLAMLDRQLAALKAENETAWAQAHRLALELECLLLDTKDNAIVSKWWDSGMAALNEYQQLKPGAKEDAEAWAKMRKETL